MSQQHTPEPWKHVGQGDIIGANNDDACAAYLRTDIGDANARRIVACVNACAGIPTASLEAMPERHLDSIHKRRRMYLRQWREYLQRR